MKIISQKSKCTKLMQKISNNKKLHVIHPDSPQILFDLNEHICHLTQLFKIIYILSWEFATREANSTILLYYILITF